MTTIAYKDGIIAYDSRCTAGDLIVDDDIDKSMKQNGVVFFFSGRVDQQQTFIDKYFDRSLDVGEKISLSVVLVDSGAVYEGGFCPQEGFWCAKASNPAAHGTGERHALTAMDMGATAVEAVKMAMKRDTGTGGRVRTYRVSA